MEPKAASKKSRLSVNAMGNNLVKTGAGDPSHGISLTAEENPN